MPTLLTTNEAAKELGITVRRVQALISSGKLVAERMGRDYLIKPKDLDKVRERKTGRPPKA